VGRGKRGAKARKPRVLATSVALEDADLARARILVEGPWVEGPTFESATEKDLGGHCHEHMRSRKIYIKIVIG
jgi:hypothetical protein